MSRLLTLLAAGVVIAVAAIAAIVLLRESRDEEVVAELPAPAPCERDAGDRNPENRPVTPSRGRPLIGRVAGRIPFGFNDASYETGLLSLDATVALHRAAGASMWRLPLDWGRVERSQGELDFAAYDEIYCAAIAAGVRPVWHITGIPEWAAPLSFCQMPCVRPPEDEHLPALARFAEAAAIRYPRAAAIEAWNEPNLTFFWGDAPDPEAYVRVQRAIYEGVKDGDPELPVLGGALSNNPTDEPGGHLSLRTFLAGMLAAGAAEYMDGLALHAYPIGPLGSEGDQFSAALAETRAQLPPGMRIWITEVGAPTEPGGFAPRVNPGEQAAMMARVYRELDRAGDADAVLFHTLVDPGPEVPGGPGFGFFTAPADGAVTAKPVVCAILALAAPGRRCPDRVPV